MKVFKIVLKTLLVLLIAGGVYSVGYMYLNPQFGGSISKAEKERFSKSRQWDGEQFLNQSKTVMDLGLKEMPGLIKKQFTGRELRSPQEQLPLIKFDRKAWETDTNGFQFIWFGHSVGLMKIEGKNILIDPMFGADASPIGPFRTLRYSDSTLYIIDQLPFIDAVCITHDHYDHLDFDSFKKLKGKVGHYYVPLGVKRHLLRWEIPSEDITEFDWWDAANVGNVEMTFVPARHFSGRGLTDRGESLWGGWTYVSPTSRVYWSGDGGYDSHFKEIGERLGPFDWAFLECGQYNELWHAIHMYPEETVQAAMDVQAITSIPIHWGAFTLSLHSWKDPVQRFSQEAKEKGVNIAMPKLGEVIHFQQKSNENFWWKGFK